MKRYPIRIVAYAGLMAAASIESTATATSVDEDSAPISLVAMSFPAARVPAIEMDAYRRGMPNPKLDESPTVFSRLSGVGIFHWDSSVPGHLANPSYSGTFGAGETRFQGYRNYSPPVVSDEFDPRRWRGNSPSGFPGVTAPLERSVSLAESSEDITMSAIPEPGTASLMAVGLLGLLGRRLRNRN